MSHQPMETVTHSFATVAVTAMGHSQQHQVELIQSAEGYAVGCPALPGCWSQGDTREQALINIAQAIRDYLEVKQELKQRHVNLHKVA